MYIRYIFLKYGLLRIQFNHLIIYSNGKVKNKTVQLVAPSYGKEIYEAIVLCIPNKKAISSDIGKSFRPTCCTFQTLRTRRLVPELVTKHRFYRFHKAFLIYKTLAIDLALPY